MHTNQWVKLLRGISSASGGYALICCWLAPHLTTQKASMHSISPRNMPVACRKGWLKGLLVPSTDSEVMVSAHLTERVLKDPKIKIMPARPK